ncbi:MAG TPA: 16S rRNA (cytosine(967)-C(5))-methyltransferase RsmB [Casimicrobiaceae bacterium]|nr:16S rRNA (cytosine(967)-C(5))-methyltransferase RsmB [Casimicrobiaceae bacterium]
MRQSQVAAAQTVARVLGGQSLSMALRDAGADDAGPARSLIVELAYGTLRHYGTLSAVSRALATRSIAGDALQALVLVALYQLEHGNVPHFAVVDQAVEAVDEVARADAKGFVNAILRRFLRERVALLEAVEREPVARWSHPRWWISRVRSDWPQHWETMLRAGNMRPPLSLRVNARQATRESVVAGFEDAGIAARIEGASGVVVDPPRPVHELPRFDEGAFSVQDLGAQLAAPLLRVEDGMCVLDACAAPGGKTTHLLESRSIRLTAIDTDSARLARVRENVTRLRLDGDDLVIREGDARNTATWWDGAPFDRILADVPCTASGVVRRHPDAKWLRRKRDVAAFAALQREILRSLWPTLAPGGLLLYATCSIFREENAAVVDAFVEATPGALRETLNWPDAIAHSGGQLLPSTEATGHNQDGFFYALVRKHAAGGR